MCSDSFDLTKQVICFDKTFIPPSLNDFFSAAPRNIRLFLRLFRLLQLFNALGWPDNLGLLLGIDGDELFGGVGECRIYVYSGLILAFPPPCQTTIFDARPFHAKHPLPGRCRLVLPRRSQCTDGNSSGCRIHEIFPLVKSSQEAREDVACRYPRLFNSNGRGIVQKFKIRANDWGPA